MVRKRTTGSIGAKNGEEIVTSIPAYPTTTTRVARITPRLVCLPSTTITPPFRSSAA
jgi:hypothetical protein